MAESYQKWNSWGRTRGPKNLAGANGVPVNVLEDTDGLLGVTASTEGYNTENQRYLHVLITDSNTTAPAVTKIFGYCHAFQRWFEIPETETGGEGQNTANAASSIACADSGRAPAAQVPSDREYRRYDIAGIDKIAFVNADASEVVVFAACSTF
jgi:hypothetical protein